MKYHTKQFKSKPTQAEINKAADAHEIVQDYCKVWLADGTKKYFKNDMPVLGYYSGGPGRSYYYIYFVSKHLQDKGSFGRLGIIRSKRVIIG